MSETMTEAGKQLLAQIIPEDWEDGEWTFPLDPAAAISAIEAEAVAADRLHRGWTAEERAEHEAHDEGLIAFERARITAEVEKLSAWDKRSVPGGFHVLRTAVLAIVNPEADHD